MYCYLFIFGIVVKCHYCTKDSDYLAR